MKPVLELETRMEREPTIYVIDGDAAVRDSIRTMLESHGFTVASFASGQEFLCCARSKSSSCIVLELHLPGISGLEVLDRVRREGDSISVIAITGRPNPTIRQAVEARRAITLEKPFLGRELVAAVKKAVADAEGGR
jgi:FixJ family two-component response regulator